MILKNDWLWDIKLTVKKARTILKNSDNARFLSIAALLLSRKNTPKEVFKYYIKPVDFLRNWNAIKRQMRKDKWNDPRIEYWQAVYEVAKERFRHKGEVVKKKVSLPKPENEFYKTIADKIMSARKRKGLTQAALAEKLGISQQIISRIEQGKENISLSTLKKIADAIKSEINLEII